MNVKSYFTSKGLDVFFPKNKDFSYHLTFPKKKRELLLIFFTDDPEDLDEKFKSKFLSLIEDTLSLSTLDNCSDNQVKKQLTDFLQRLNKRLRDTSVSFGNNLEGISLSILLESNNFIVSAQFGRFFSGIANHKGISFFEKDISDDFFSNDYIDSSIKLSDIKFNEYNLKENELFFVLPSCYYKEFKLSFVNHFQLLQILQKKSKKTAYPFCTIFRREIVKTRIVRKWKQKIFRVYALIILLMLIISGYYVFWGNNKIEDQLHIIREQVNLTIRNIDFVRLQETLPLDYGLLFIPARNINMVAEWVSELDYKVTYEPKFDMFNLYIVSNNTVNTYSKADKKNIWRKEFDDNVNYIEILDANLMLVHNRDGKTYCLKRDSGGLVWKIESEPKISDNNENYYIAMTKPGRSSLKVRQITLEQDRRLYNSIIVYPEENSIKLLNILNGDTLSVYQTDKKISYISNFDFLEKSFYLVEDNYLMKVKVEVF